MQVSASPEHLIEQFASVACDMPVSSRLGPSFKDLPNDLRRTCVISAKADSNAGFSEADCRLQHEHALSSPAFTTASQLLHEVSSTLQPIMDDAMPFDDSFWMLQCQQAGSWAPRTCDCNLI